MSDNEVSAYQFDTETTTRIVTKLHRVKWTIENVSELHPCLNYIEDYSEYHGIKGPEIFFMGKCMCYLTFIRLRDALMVSLYNTSDQAIEITKSQIFLLDFNGTQLVERILHFFTVKKQKHTAIMFVLINDLEKEFHSLKDDKLIIDCSLKIKGYVITKSDSLKSGTESRNKLLNDLKVMYNNPDGSDFTFKVGDEFIHAHKTVLSFRSTYFKKMFDTEMVEKVQDSVLITDISYTTMKKLVEYLYTGDFTFARDIQDAINLYIAADKYQVIDLRSLCSEKLISMASVDDILGLLQLAERHNDKGLKLKAMKFVSLHFDKVIKQNSWKTFVSENVNLASEVLNFC